MPEERYHFLMTIEGLQNYFGAKLPLALNAQQIFRLLRTVFALVFLATAVIHLLVKQEIQLQLMFLHAVTIGLVYTLAVALAITFLYSMRGSVREVRVWHVWMVSLSSFVCGFYFLPIDDGVVWLLGIVTNDHAIQMRMPQLLPVWFVLTYFFVQPYLNEGLKHELSRLREINHLLQQHRTAEPRASTATIHFDSGRAPFTLSADSIRNIVVEDHYCYIHHKHKGEYTKRDVAIPLRDIQTLLPDEFLQLHRSHIVNPNYITSVSRKNRKIRVVLDGGYEIPVSRHRLGDVLPKIRALVP